MKTARKQVDDTLIPEPAFSAVVAPSSVASSSPVTASRLAGMVILFIFGLLALDQSVLRIGDKLVASSYWTDNLVAHVASPEDWDVLFLGTCRAWVLRSPVMESILGKKVLNAGVRTSRIPTTAFYLAAAGTRQRGKPVVLLLDYFVLSPTAESTRLELDILMLYWSYLPEADQKRLMDDVGISRLALLGSRSGLWKYRGRGNPMLRAALRSVRGVFAPKDLPRPVGTDTYDFMKVLTMKGQAEKYVPFQEKNEETTPQGVAIADAAIGEALRAGLKPIIVIPPLHWTHATSAVNAKTIATIKALAQRYGLKVLSYLDNDGEFARNDDYWAEPAHFNGKGADAFSQRLATDLKGILP